MDNRRIAAQPGQESVWDYPRPPRLEPVSKLIQISFNGAMIADTTRAYRVLETSHPPVYYLPPSDIALQYVVPAEGSSWCEWKGAAVYFSLVVGERRVEKAGWAYPNPTADFAALAGYIAFYAAPLDRCSVDGEQVTPQPGDFYGGWITRDIVGPFKGGPGSRGW
jgi:uncharacterized protein (DUF427 family)